jgi:hypothetical protein
MLEDCFKPEDRKRGQDLIADTVIASRSDTAVRAYIKSVKISLKADDVASPLIRATCSCSSSQPCKHLWAVILKLNGADFLESKNQIETEDTPATPVNQVHKERQAEFRKQAYAKQKARAKTLRAEKKQLYTPPAYPSEVEDARAYFSQNGFELEPLDSDGLLNAKKLLSRVFHPDKGGTHEETVTLNRNFEILQEYLKG